MAGSTCMTATALNRLGQYESSPGNRAYCYAELAVSSLAEATTVASTRFAYPQRDGRAELAREVCVFAACKIWCHDAEFMKRQNVT